MRSKGGSQIIYLMACLKFLIMAQCVPTVNFHNQFQVPAMLFLSQFFFNFFFNKHPHRKLFQCIFFIFDRYFCCMFFSIPYSKVSKSWHISHIFCCNVKCFIYSRVSAYILCHLQQHFRKMMRALSMI